MKILVLSDSHSGLSFMRRCIDRVKPDALIHLGDYYDDGQTMEEEYPHIRMYQVPGNCDRYRCPPFAREIWDFFCGMPGKAMSVRFFTATPMWLTAIWKRMVFGYSIPVPAAPGAAVQD